MCSAEEQMNERLRLRSMKLDLRTKEVCKQVSLYIRYGSGREVRARSEYKGTCITPIALQIHLDAKITIDVEYHCSTTTVQAVTIASSCVRGKSCIGVVKPHLTRGELLGPRTHCQQHDRRNYTVLHNCSHY